MNINIYKQELKSNLKSVWIWSASIVALIVVFMSIFQTFATSTISVEEIMKSFPKELLIAFGMVDMDWTTVLGYFGLIFVFVQICLAIQAANYGFALVSVEETEWTADFLLSKPVSRNVIMTSKLLAALTCLVITNAVVWITSFLSVNVFSKGELYQTGNLVTLLGSMLVFQLFFLTTGMVISLLVKRVRSVIPFSMGLVFGLYVLNAFGEMIGEMSLEVISPFKHFAPSYIVKHAAWDMPLPLISVAILIISLVGSYVLYARRNISSAA